jgi:hypothetical protein
MATCRVIRRKRFEKNDKKLDYVVYVTALATGNKSTTYPYQKGEMIPRKVPFLIITDLDYKIKSGLKLSKFIICPDKSLLIKRPQVIKEEIQNNKSRLRSDTPASIRHVFMD